MHINSLSRKIQAIWTALGGTGDQYVLVGDTALAYRLGHRVSVDVDLATSGPSLHPNRLRSNWGHPPIGKHKWVRRSPDHYIRFFEASTAPKIDVHGKVQGGCLERPERAPNGLRIASVTDILKQKLVAMHWRERERDGKDVAAILERSLADVPNAVAGVRDQTNHLGLGALEAALLGERLADLEDTVWGGVEPLKALVPMLCAPEWQPPAIVSPRIEGPDRIESMAEAKRPTNSSLQPP